MSNAFHLRPVDPPSPSPSPTASTGAGSSPSHPHPGHGHSHSLPPSHSHHPSASTSSISGPSLPPSASSSTAPSSATNTNAPRPPPRRPLSPSSLRALDLTAPLPSSPSHPSRANPKYPAPPTGHDLMAMFPPPPPDAFPELLRGGPTSGFFQRQERAFFAQAGREIVRVRVEVDFPGGGEEGKPSRIPSTASANGGGGGARPWMHAPPPGHSPTQSTTAPVLYPHPASRPGHTQSLSLSQSRTGPGLSPNTPSTASSTSPTANGTGGTPTLAHPHAHAGHPHPHGFVHPQEINGLNGNGMNGVTGGLNGGAKAEYTPDEREYDPDEAWRRPMPYNERRRAGKHTRRVIVRT